MSVKVAIRVRPFNQRQKFLGCICCVDMREGTTVLYENRDKNKKQHYFTFDYSFWSHDGFTVREDGLLVPANNKYIDQAHVYEFIGQDILQNAWKGYNCCLFAYGQTGSGKSYSMIGFGVNKGIIPTACEHLFQEIRKQQKRGHKQYEVTLSMLQIYNEKVQDLFVNTSRRPVNGLKIRQNKTLGVYVQGLTKYPVRSFKEIEKLMEEGSKNRSLASTLMNEYSSRAHTIIMIQFVQKEFVSAEKMNKRSSVVNLVDLAGSERVAKTGIDNKDRLKEASNINKSLHTLGRVIESLAEQAASKKQLQVPYRESALTRILENALGGNSKTTMICAISPANDNYEETLSTLRYADQTKKIKNKPLINESAVDKLIRELREENQRLKNILKQSQQAQTVNGHTLTDLQRKQVRSNVKASMHLVQNEIRKNLQSFAMNVDIIDEEDSLLMGDFVDLVDPSTISQASFDTNQRAQVYISNLNEDEILNNKVKYSCDSDLLVTSKRHGNSCQSSCPKVVLCGLGIEDNHARIYRKDSKFYISAGTETSAEYTLVNGKPVYVPRELNNNDRIILGTNSVFVFRINQNSLGTSRIEENQLDLNINYEFAMNERQSEMESMSLISPTSLSLFSSGSLSKLSQQTQSSEIYRPNNPLSATRKLFEQEKDGELVKQLESIEKEFTDLVKENERKMKEKQQLYKSMLSDLKKEKEKERLQKLDLQEKLAIKSIEAEQMKSKKENQLQALKKKLQKYNQQRNRYSLARESMLLEDDTAEQELQQFQQVPNKFMEQEQGTGIAKLQGKKKPRQEQRKKQFEYPDIVLQQAEDHLLQIPRSISRQSDELLIDYREPQPQYHRKKLQIVRTVNEKLKASKVRQFVFQRYLNLQVLSEAEKAFICELCHMKLKKPLDRKMSENLRQTGQIRPRRQTRDDVIISHAQLSQYSEDSSLKYSQGDNAALQSLLFKTKQDTLPLGHGPVKMSYSLGKPDSIDDDSLLMDYLPPDDMSRNGSDAQNLKEDYIFRKREIKLFKQTLEFINIIGDYPQGIDEKTRLSDQKRPIQNKKYTGVEFGISIIAETATVDTQTKEEEFIGLQDHRLQVQKQQKVNLGSHQIKVIPQLQPLLREQTINEVAELCQGETMLIDTSNQQIYPEPVEPVEPEAQPQISPIRKLEIVSNKDHQEQLNRINGSLSLTDISRNILAQPYKQSKVFALFPCDQIVIKGSQQQNVEMKIQNKGVGQSNVQNEEKGSKEKGISVQGQKPGLNLSVSDISVNELEQQLSYLNLDGLIKEDELNKKIQLLQQKIYELESRNLTNENTPQKIESKYSSQQNLEQRAAKGNTQGRPRKATIRPRAVTRRNGLSEQSKKQRQAQRELQAKIIQCNNQNLINERNIQIFKRKRQADQLRKMLFKKQKIELQKQLLVIIPMIKRFNLMAKDMHKLIEGKINVEYRNFSHFEMIDALKNYTQRRQGGTNIQISIIITNCEQGRVYSWPFEVFKNRFEIAEQIFEKYEQGSQIDQNDKSKDPFWDPIDFMPQGLGYLSLQSLLYNISFEGKVSVIDRSQIIAQMSICLVPVQVNPQYFNDSNSQDDSQMQIFNLRNLLQKDIYFNLVIEDIRFCRKIQRDPNVLKYYISYQFIEKDYKLVRYCTPELEFTQLGTSDKEKMRREQGELGKDIMLEVEDDKILEESPQEINYLRRHCLKEISERTLAYLSDCPIKLNLHIMKDYNEECLHSSFNESYGSEMDVTSEHSTSKDLSSNLDQSTVSHQTHQTESPVRQEKSKMDFSKKEKASVFYENTEIISKIDNQLKRSESQQQQKKKQSRAAKEQNKDCAIY